MTTTAALTRDRATTARAAPRAGEMLALRGYPLDASDLIAANIHRVNVPTAAGDKVRLASQAAFRAKYNLPEPVAFDWLMVLWDKKGRVVCRERGNNVATLIAFAENMIAEASAADWELIDLPLCRLATEPV